MPTPYFAISSAFASENLPFSSRKCVKGTASSWATFSSTESLATISLALRMCSGLIVV